MRTVPPLCIYGTEHAWRFYCRSAYGKWWEVCAKCGWKRITRRPLSPEVEEEMRRNVEKLGETHGRE